MVELVINDTQAFGTISSKMKFYSTINPIPKFKKELFTDINFILDTISNEASLKRIMVGNYFFHTNVYIYILFFENKQIFLLDQFFIQENSLIFRKILNQLYFFNNKIEEEFTNLLSNSHLSSFSTSNFQNFDVSEFKKTIANYIIKRSQLLTQENRQKLCLDNIPINTQYKSTDFVDILNFKSTTRLCFNINDHLLYVLKLFDERNEESMKLYEREKSMI